MAAALDAKEQSHQDALAELRRTCDEELAAAAAEQQGLRREVQDLQNSAIELSNREDELQARNQALGGTGAISAAACTDSLHAELHRLADAH